MISARLGLGSQTHRFTDYFLANYREPVRQMMVADAVEMFIAEREKQNRRPDTIRNLRGRLGMFSEKFGQNRVPK